MIHQLIDFGIWFGGFFVWSSGASYTFTRLHRRHMAQCCAVNHSMTPETRQHLKQCWHVERDVLLSAVWPAAIGFVAAAAPPVLLGRHAAMQSKPFREQKALMSGRALEEEAKRLDELEKQLGIGPFGPNKVTFDLLNPGEKP